jgi:tetratricopeptide (TPR) repeat protein
MRFLALVLAAIPVWAADPWSDSYKLESQKQYAQAAQVLAPLAQTQELAQLRVAYLSYLQGKYDESIAGYTKALQMNAFSLDAPLGMTLPLLAQGRYEEAAVQARSVLAKCTWNYTAHVRLLACEEGLRNWSAMVTHARMLVLRYPSDATLWVYLGRAEARLGSKDQAVMAYQRVLQLYPAHNEALAFLQEPK